MTRSNKDTFHDIQQQSFTNRTVIIGGGIVGFAIAYYLSRDASPKQIVLIDDRVEAYSKIPAAFQRVGGLEIASTEAGIASLHNRRESSNTTRLKQKRRAFVILGAGVRSLTASINHSREDGSLFSSRTELGTLEVVAVPHQSALYNRVKESAIHDSALTVFQDPAQRKLKTPHTSFNAMFSVTPGSMPFAGAVPSIPGIYVAAAVWITHAAGVGRLTSDVVLGKWLAKEEEYPPDLASMFGFNSSSIVTKSFSHRPSSNELV
ncbi:uncharacterized protein RSE6_08431 [Rhynchosporium secalis]|uniref:Uncharacterized protein n=1 Tax=Rhynchosporium secalis TaxID=38038 RepID=A0A1E1MFE1_RHYSE|nr:uncharacterized protein RSE6_08431 [Rhynchosporium secalis]